jgi:hypothetical protein
MIVSIVPRTIGVRAGAAARRCQLLSLNSRVQAVLRSAGVRRWPDGGWGLALTVYEHAGRVQDACGGHWTLFWSQEGADAHELESYTISLLFDGNNQASGFLVDGECSVRVPAKPDSLARILRTLPPHRRRAGRTTKPASHGTRAPGASRPPQLRGSVERV